MMVWKRSTAALDMAISDINSLDFWGVYFGWKTPPGPNIPVKNKDLVVGIPAPTFVDRQPGGDELASWQWRC